MLYTVGEMAKRLGIAPSTLRYYDKEGLLPFLERSKGGIRMFKDADFEWLTVIECLKETGMSIKEIKDYIYWSMEGDATIDQRLALIEQRQKAVLSQIQQLQQTLLTLEYKQWYYETAKKAGSCQVHKSLSQEDIPARFHSVWKKINGSK